MQANLHCKLAFIWERAACGGCPQLNAATCSCNLVWVALLAAYRAPVIQNHLLATGTNGFGLHCICIPKQMQCKSSLIASKAI